MQVKIIKLMNLHCTFHDKKYIWFAEIYQPMQVKELQTQIICLELCSSLNSKYKWDAISKITVEERN